MHLSIRNAKTSFTEAAQAAARGERVVVTKHGRPFVELIAARPAAGMDFHRAGEIRRQLGLEQVALTLPAEFDDPAYSAQVLGLDA